MGKCTDSKLSFRLLKWLFNTEIEMLKEQVIKVYRAVFKSDRIDGFKISYCKLNSLSNFPLDLRSNNHRSEEYKIIPTVLIKMNRSVEIISCKTLKKVSDYLEQRKKKNLKLYKLQLQLRYKHCNISNCPLYDDFY